MRAAIPLLLWAGPALDSALMYAIQTFARVQDTFTDPSVRFVDYGTVLSNMSSPLFAKVFAYSPLLNSPIWPDSTRKIYVLDTTSLYHRLYQCSGTEALQRPRKYSMWFVFRLFNSGIYSEGKAISKSKPPTLCRTITSILYASAKKLRYSVVRRRLVSEAFWPTSRKTKFRKPSTQKPIHLTQGTQSRAKE